MSCESTNELIKEATYDIALNIGIWGLITFTSVAITPESYDPSCSGYLIRNGVQKKNNKLRLTFQLLGLFMTGVTVYKYSK